MLEVRLQHGVRVAEGAWPLRRICSFPVALCAVLAITIFALARNGLADPDIWWHLRNADYMLREHTWLRADMYSYTVFGRPWMDHEWLAEIPYYLAWRAFGLAGIKALSLLILATVFGALLYLCQRKSRNIKASAIACSLAVFLGSVSFGPRTILFGYGFLVLLLLLLERFRRRGDAPLWLLPILFCVWVNTHGSWFLGLIVLLIYIGCGLKDIRWGNVEAARWSTPQLRRLSVAAAASIAAVFVNPYGYRLVLYPLDMAFHQKLNISHVAEWSSVDFHDVRGKVALIFLLAMLLGALLSKHTWQLHEVGLVLFGTYAALTYVRFLFLAGILAAPVIANFLSSIPDYKPEIDRPFLNALLIAAAMAFVIVGFPTESQLRQSVAREYPADILSYLEAAPPSGRILNYYLWGGYLGWMAPSIKDFVDSRVDVFESAGIFRDYLDLLELKNPAAILEKYHVRYVLFPPSEPLSYALQHDPEWKVVFAGDVSILFEKVVGEKPSASSAQVESGVPAGGERLFLRERPDLGTRQ